MGQNESKTSATSTNVHKARAKSLARGAGLFAGAFLAAAATRPEYTDTVVLTVVTPHTVELTVTFTEMFGHATPIVCKVAVDGFNELNDEGKKRAALNAAATAYRTLDGQQQWNADYASVTLSTLSGAVAFSARFRKSSYRYI